VEEVEDSPLVKDQMNYLRVQTDKEELLVMTERSAQQSSISLNSIKKQS